MAKPQQLLSDRVGAFVLAIAIHALFSIQVFMALPVGLVANDAAQLIFLPHYFLIYFLPPVWPIHEGVVDYTALWGKLAVAFPASIIYGLVTGLILSFVRRLFRKSKT